MKSLHAKIKNYRNLAPVAADGTCVTILEFVGTGEQVMAVCMDGNHMLLEVPVGYLKLLPSSIGEFDADAWREE